MTFLTVGSVDPLFILSGRPTRFRVGPGSSNSVPLGLPPQPEDGCRGVGRLPSKSANPYSFARAPMSKAWPVLSRLACAPRGRRCSSHSRITGRPHEPQIDGCHSVLG